MGVHISEFPINIEAAKAAHQAGISTFGAPNIVRGRSQSSGMRAVDTIRAAWPLACVPTTCIVHVSSHFKIFKESILSLPDAVKLGTLHPARAINDPEIGRLRSAKRPILLLSVGMGNILLSRVLG